MGVAGGGINVPISLSIVPTLGEDPQLVYYKYLTQLTL